MFVNRESELAVLQREYAREGASFTVIYGRRRVGKTALIGEYIKDKPAVYFYVTERNLKEQLKQITRQIVEYTGKDYLKNVEFSDFEQLFEFLSEHIRERKLAFVLDEYQNFAELDKSFSSMLMKVWDLKLKFQNIHLILCGSVISMMYSETLSYSSPLYGRRTSNIHLKPLSFHHIEDFVKNASKIHRMNIYASFGTVPKYLELYDNGKAFLENIRDNILDKNSYLYQEVKFLLKEEISEPTTYFNILEAISDGETKIGKIGSRLNVHSSYLTRYMRKLADLDIVAKEVPITEKAPSKSKLGKYKIKDQFIKFWFYYVYRNYSYLEIGNVDYVLDEIKRTFNENFVSSAFEDYVKELLTHNPLEFLGFRPRKIGRWWNNSEEIDLVAIGDNSAAFIECKWQNQKVGYTVYNNLTRKADIVNLPPSLKKVYVIFSKSGFKDNLEKAEGRFYTY
ncbi:MAG: AAA family ATPase [Candidatus Aminicenantes bacterium]|nr:AAA family ATPase [Candidatus Aminicenantes bacterium]NIM79986.1 AAA family ATPase [Candidatus Aminicenantes bacterium]NIN19338.1 AAA family ATPase [Candidatus Aminicenantes bacterium]NIN43237.1 AAA family ATPase [Candidatus Aminicenantes bacterium]NIN85979.1 AAA family ATPase [Candidatus Aminicenantes bacterium]